ncbi:hypothetical protein, partial [Enterobacter cloacae]|uniref:hypothetical protein n=1 Tax=Enterobacter cloacae TaxID=550 RepID=UPI0028F892E3
MGNKNSFDSSVRKGVQVYWQCGQRIVVVHPGGYLERIEDGQCVLFETTPHEDGTRLYWFGVTSSNAYYFMLEVAQPVDIFAVSGLAPIFPYTFYHLTHDWFVAADIPV